MSLFFLVSSSKPEVSFFDGALQVMSLYFQLREHHFIYLQFLYFSYFVIDRCSCPHLWTVRIWFFGCVGRFSSIFQDFVQFSAHFVTRFQWRLLVSLHDNQRRACRQICDYWHILFMLFVSCLSVAAYQGSYIVKVIEVNFAMIHTFNLLCHALTVRHKRSPLLWIVSKALPKSVSLL